ncbi:MAG: formate/nitrite transporter family protein [Rhodospirillaceae bacterium]|jgi:formate transporter|nr:formate/nitrite transporter family protein [Rhodospirillales bacterium]MBT3904106.1 formate/nitrite transporter family protein [Rhodospirillaceae bacterium]MBT4699518.1 formate/nitrite transporter family protein [Rhodospirillaceae bacterium]MBT5035494.1 formate/nitrite transporter family protein [Rhodospirillaceae bacterium]MBT6219308.1 formate/nitrite transporter family protein [Rhodospirillaceae bacterium]
MDETPQRRSIDIDAYAPPEIASRIETAGVKKAHLPVLQTMVLAVLAGAFIAFGGMFYTLVVTDSGMGFGPQRLLGGIAFSLGLILVVIAGAELFTGNNLIVMAWAENKISTHQLMRNWLLVYIGNFVGAMATALIVYWSGILSLGDGALGETAKAIAHGKVQLPFMEAFLRGVLCNTLVCLAVWLCFAAHTVTGKILAIIFPVSAFVALGFEHSVANMYLIPIGYLASVGDSSATGLMSYFTATNGITLSGFIGNLVPVTLGNIVGGSVFVALVYWIVYLRDTDS